MVPDGGGWVGVESCGAKWNYVGLIGSGRNGGGLRAVGWGAAERRRLQANATCRG